MANEEVEKNSNFDPLNTKIFGEQNDYPKKEHLLQWMEVTVSEPERRTGGPSVKMQDVYMVYLVETRVTDPDMPGYGEATTSLWRRYSEFELLKSYLEVLYPAVVIPPLPEKRVTHTWCNLSTDRFDEGFIERRRSGLENFLLRVASHCALCQDKVFHAFLKQEDGWRETVYATEYYNKGDSKLKALSAVYRVRQPERRFEELKHYSNELQTHINNILKIRARVCEKAYSVQKVHQNYGRVFTEWGAIEADMGGGLSQAAQYMDVYAKWIDTQLEDEEQFAEHLKEYHSFADSLRNICRKQETLQLDVEKAEDNLSSKNHQREQLAQGKVGAFTLSGMKTKLFGGDTPEQRDAKLKQLDEDITDCEARVKLTSQQLEEFIEVALRDVERFRRQKVKDLKDVFTSYAVMQIDRCKKDVPKAVTKCEENRKKLVREIVEDNFHRIYHMQNNPLNTRRPIEDPKTSPRTINVKNPSDQRHVSYSYSDEWKGT